MQITRMIIFTRDVERLAEFYRSSFKLEFVGQASSEWAELRSGSCDLAFHRTDEEGVGRDGWTKLVFGSLDVAAERQRLVDRGVEMTEIVEFEGIQLADGRDPDGNPFQISSRGMHKRRNLREVR